MVENKEERRSKVVMVQLTPPEKRTVMMVMKIPSSVLLSSVLAVGYLVCLVHIPTSHSLHQVFDKDHTHKLYGSHVDGHTGLPENEDPYDSNQENPIEATSEDPEVSKTCKERTPEVIYKGIPNVNPSSILLDFLHAGGRYNLAHSKNSKLFSRSPPLA